MKPIPDDPGSLSRLHDIATVPPAPWWPPAPAWHVIGALLLMGMIALAIWTAIRWRRNWYRRAGLAELRRIAQARPLNQSSLFEVAELLKRVALVAYPRVRVASLTGAEWLEFLNQTAGTKDFVSGPGRLIASIYDPAPTTPTPEVFDAARHWIRRHRRESGC